MEGLADGDPVLRGPLGEEGDPTEHQLGQAESDVLSLASCV